MDANFNACNLSCAGYFQRSIITRHHMRNYICGIDTKVLNDKHTVLAHMQVIAINAYAPECKHSVRLVNRIVSTFHLQ